MMKKTAAVILLVFVFFSSAAAHTPSVAALPTTANGTSAGYTPNKYLDDRLFSDFVGRLVLPYTGIDVALYDDVSQLVCDREDSACCFQYLDYDGLVIADHSDQDFSKLYDVYIGEIGEIIHDDGSSDFILCVDTFRGHNTGYDITDNDYNNVLGDADILMYTCADGWENVFVCQWVILESNSPILSQINK